MISRKLTLIKGNITFGETKIRSEHNSKNNNKQIGWRDKKLASTTHTHTHVYGLIAVWKNIAHAYTSASTAKERLEFCYFIVFTFFSYRLHSGLKRAARYLFFSFVCVSYTCEWISMYFAHSTNSYVCSMVKKKTCDQNTRLQQTKIYSTFCWFGTTRQLDVIHSSHWRKKRRKKDKKKTTNHSRFPQMHFYGCWHTCRIGDTYRK